MGNRYSQTHTKTRQQSAQHRCERQLSKQLNEYNQHRRTAANYLNEGKDETARIFIETIQREEKQTHVLERQKVMLMQLYARINIQDKPKLYTQDLLECIASIIYMRNRIPEIRELNDIIKQFKIILGEEFVKCAENNIRSPVSPIIISLLDLRSPPLDVVLSSLHDIAKEYNIAWVPKLVNHDTVLSCDAIGSVASPIANSNIGKRKGDVSNNSEADGRQQQYQR